MIGDSAEAMDTRVRTSLQPMRAPAAPKPHKEMEKEKRIEIPVSKPMDVPTAKGLNRCHSRRETKIALQQDVDKLKKKLRHEENVHRALERAFTRPLGALPRLPPYLPSNTLELLAEVAVLEEEVVRLEEQVVNFRQGLYHEAIYISSKRTEGGALEAKCERFQNSKTSEQSKICADSANGESNPSVTKPWSSDAIRNKPSPINRFPNGKRPWKKPNSCAAILEDRRGKENQSDANSTRNTIQSPVKKVQRIKMPVVTEKQLDSQPECPKTNNIKVEDNFRCASEEAGFASGPNRVSEEILRCLLSIFSRASLSKNTGDLESSPSVSGSSGSSEDLGFLDPYDICSEFGRRDIGPYKHMCVVRVSSIDPALISRTPFLTRRLKVLLRKLALVELSGLTHQQKLAFWINIYNSCMMNAYLEQGIPATPQMVVQLMTKAMINVGGHLLSAMTIEHFILRLPYHSKHTFPKGLKSDEMTTRGIVGLDWREPLVTFALSCGSWSSPAVRVYTSSQVEKELEIAKRDYLQAAVGIAMPNKLAIPKLLDWYLLDFAKDVESLMDWVCLQLPSELRNTAFKCLETGRSLVPKPIQVMPYEFRFRYILAP